MKVLFDTSVLVAAMVSAHRAHSRCRPWLTRACSGEIQGFVATHTAEADRLLTLGPADFRRLWPDAGDVIQEP